MIYGHVVCQNAVSDIVRCLESISLCCDELMVVDGGSTDGTRELLEQRKGIYKLKIFDRPFDTLKQQRQFLLEQTPKDHWVVVLDQDEKFTFRFENYFRLYLSRIAPEIYEHSELPLISPLPHFNLINDTRHFAGDAIVHNQRAFYYNKSLHWYGHPYHAHITYDAPAEEGYVSALDSVKGFGILHYARLDPKRLSWRKNYLNDPKYGDYVDSSWGEDKPVINTLTEEYF